MFHRLSACIIMYSNTVISWRSLLMLKLIDIGWYKNYSLSALQQKRSHVYQTRRSVLTFCIILGITSSECENTEQGKQVVHRSFYVEREGRGDICLKRLSWNTPLFKLLPIASACHILYMFIL